VTSGCPASEETKVDEKNFNPIDACISQSALTIKRDVIQKAGGYDPLFEWGEEWDLMHAFTTMMLKLC